MVINEHGLSKRERNGSAQSRNRVPSAIDLQSRRESRSPITKNNDRRTGETGQDGVTGMAAAAAQATLPSWATMVLMVSLIFGGCCSNVFALEAIIKEQPSAGPLITFAQFLLTALFTYPSFLSFSAGPRSLFLNPRAIPLRSWLVYTAFFVSVNILNNWAFAYKISVPLHIILRSGGPVASMVIGYFFNARRYSTGQVLAVAMLTMGVVAAALADAATKGQSIGFGSEVDGNETVDIATTTAGLSMLALAMILSAFQGIYADRLYETHGRSHWREALFYSHTLSLPLFLPTYPQIASQWRSLLASPPLLDQVSAATTEYGYLYASHSSLLGAGGSTGLRAALTAPLLNTLTSVLFVLQKNPWTRSLLANIPVKVGYLLMNILTQYVCIRGVHLLSARSSSLTVTIVLNIRKLVSLLLSIYLFGNTLAPGVLVGAVFVFVGGGLYGFEGARLRKGKTSVKKE